jgi:hypothetical protein
LSGEPAIGSGMWRAADADASTLRRDRSAVAPRARACAELSAGGRKRRPVELSSRLGNIFWYSGESYQRFKAALSGNSMMTIVFGCGPPSISSVAPPRTRKRPPYCVIVAPARRPIGREPGRVGDLVFRNQISRHVRLPADVFATGGLRTCRVKSKAACFLTNSYSLFVLPGSPRTFQMAVRLSMRRQMAAHESPRTTKLYDRTKERLTQDEVERIRL